METNEQILNEMTAESRENNTFEHIQPQNNLVNPAKDRGESQENDHHNDDLDADLIENDKHLGSGQTDYHELRTGPDQPEQKNDEDVNLNANVDAGQLGQTEYENNNGRADIDEKAQREGSGI